MNYSGQRVHTKENASHTHRAGTPKMIDECFNLYFPPIVFITKNTVESEQRIQLLTKYQQI